MNLKPLHDEIRSAAENLPAGATLVIPEVPWDDYEHLLESFGDRSRLRVSYDCGRLEIMSPSPRHEKFGAFLEDLVRAFAQIRKLSLEKLGHTTWRRRALSKSVEADACYYIQDAESVIGKNEFDLEVDSPPDIIVEIDVALSSMRKLSIYAALSVPEVWRYDGQHLKIYELADTTYVEIAASRFLPGLSAAVLEKYIDLSGTQGQTKALNAFIRKMKGRR